MNAINQNDPGLQIWDNELESLLASARPEERAAIEAFRLSLRPYLKDPKRLRTLLGKIAMTNGGSSRMSLASNDQQFGSIEELRNFINDDSVEITLE